MIIPDGHPTDTASFGSNFRVDYPCGSDPDQGKKSD
jgi:hypothetical protein